MTAAAVWLGTVWWLWLLLAAAAIAIAIRSWRNSQPTEPPPLRLRDGDNGDEW